MIRGTWVYRDGELVPKHLASPLIPRRARSRLPAPYLNLDTIDAFQSMADGRMYDSKAAYRAELKRQGLREVGNDVEGHLKDAAARAPKKPKVRGDLIKAYRKVKEGYRPPPAPPLDPELG